MDTQRPDPTRRDPAPLEGADLQTQLETLLSAVWDAQRAWEQENLWDLRLAQVELRRLAS